MRRILFDCERMKYPNTGLYHFCLHLGSALLRQADPEQEEIAFYLPDAEQKVFGDSCTYITQKSYHKLVFPSLRTFDIWHCTFQGSNYRPLRFQAKEVFTIHDLNFLYEHSERPEKIKRSLRKMQQLVDRASAICTISEYVKNDLQRHLDLGNKPVHVIFNGCNIDTTVALQPPAYTPSAPFLFTVGTIMRKKNFHVLPALLLHNDYQLLIAGITQEEDYAALILQEAERLGVADRLVFPGAISENDKCWYLQHCTAFSFPSLAEGFGLPVIEAMAYGKPVFLSKATSLPEIGGSVAYYFDSFEPEAMSQSLQQGLDHYRRENPQALIKERAAGFNWDTAARQYIQLYRSL